MTTGHNYDLIGNPVRGGIAWFGSLAGWLGRVARSVEEGRGWEEGVG